MQEQAIHTSGVPGDEAEAMPSPVKQSYKLPLMFRLREWWAGRRPVRMRTLRTLVSKLTTRDKLIEGLRSDLEATQQAMQTMAQQLAEARGETIRIEHFLEVLREPVEGMPRGHYELKLIPRAIRRHPPKPQRRSRR